MKKLLISLLLVLCILPLSAKPKHKQDKDGFVFTTVKENPITSVKNQNRSGTCWCFSGLSFFEAELLREGKGTYDLSEMFVVRNTYMERAENYVRLHGYSSFLAGGSFFDVLDCMKKHGIMTEEAYKGIMYNDTLFNFNEIDAVTQGYMDALVHSNLKKITTVWDEGLNGIYDAYFGEVPANFDYKGVNYTPQTFEKSLGLNLEDYVSITSFTHHPFYTKFPIMVPDNWRLADSYNVPVDEMMEIMDYCIMNGYTFAWGADVSEVGFTRNGIAVMPDAEMPADLTGSDMANWLKMSSKDKQKELTSKPLPEIKVTQETRQLGYDNWETGDDHGMLIFGIAKDQNGKKYYMMKNSWGTTSKYKGIWYVSETFMKAKTMNFMLNKNAIPAAIRTKLGL